MSKFTLMYNGDKTLFQSYHHPTRFAYKGVAQRHADKHNTKRVGSRGELVVISCEDYQKSGFGNRTHMVRNIMTGEMVEENINTPYTCSVASETYWCS